jgi:predicted Zn-dependent protease
MPLWRQSLLSSSFATAALTARARITAQGAKVSRLAPAVLMLCVAACATSPLGRDQLILFPDDEIARMGVTAYQELKESTPVTKNREVNGYVECVADELIRALDSNNEGAEQWEVSVFADDQVNAFALPGGKIGVYQGLLSVAENQDQLATVVAHEIAHVLSRHSNERISTQYATSTGLELASAVAGQATPVKQTLFGLLGVGAQVGILLPFSRSQESEADLVGLELMAKAGFDPRQSVNLWRNMIAEGGDAPPEFLSTHPSGESRIRALEETMPKVTPLVEQARAGGRQPDCR